MNKPSFSARISHRRSRKEGLAKLAYVIGYPNLYILNLEGRGEAKATRDTSRR